MLWVLKRTVSKNGSFEHSKRISLNETFLWSTQNICLTNDLEINHNYRQKKLPCLGLYMYAMMLSRPNEKMPRFRLHVCLQGSDSRQAHFFFYKTFLYGKSKKTL